MTENVSSTQCPRVVLFSASLELAVPAAIALMRSATIAGVWSPEPERGLPPPGAAQTAALAQHPLRYSRVKDGSVVQVNGVPFAGHEALARALGVPYRTASLADAVAVTVALREMKIDLGLCCGVSAPMPESLRAAPRKGWLHVHASLLPRHAHAEPTFWELRSGDELAGVTVHRIGPSLYDGDVLAHDSLTLAPSLDWNGIWERKMACAHAAVDRAMAAIVSGTARFADMQPSFSESTAPATPSVKDRCVDGSMTCAHMERFVCGLRGYLSPLVSRGGELLAVEGVVSTAVDRDINAVAGAMREVGRDRLALRAVDGWVTLLVGPQVGADRALP